MALFVAAGEQGTGKFQLASPQLIQELQHLIVKSQITALMNDCLGKNIDLSTTHFSIRRFHYKPFRLFGYSLIMCKYVEAEIRWKIMHFSSFQ